MGREQHHVVVGTSVAVLMFLQKNWLQYFKKNWNKIEKNVYFLVWSHCGASVLGRGLMANYKNRVAVVVLLCTIIMEERTRWFYAPELYVTSDKMFLYEVFARF